ncbi:NAD-dependent deacetylase [Desulfitispora alkaliphila]|uniref:SIR2 family NAD-dependent protein deacylase n=1 Tax=Desulfitispora alkaliphila TaxID=622674 RepID=UPI003D1D6B8F
MGKLVAITGAGISKASGIPTFEDMGTDIRDKLTRDYFESYPEDFYSGLLPLKRAIDTAEPNGAHLALAERKVPVITMNIDGLHTKAGSKDVLEVHGNLDFFYCGECDNRYDYTELENSIYCKECSNLIQPNVVLYGDTIRSYFPALDLVGAADHVLVVGTSFYTSTVNDFVYRAQAAGNQITIINENAEEKVAQFLSNFFS